MKDLKYKIGTLTTRHTYLTVEGIKCSQTPKTLDVFTPVVGMFDTIIEIGSHQGGFTLLLDALKREEASIVSYELNPSWVKEVKNKYSHLDIRIGNSFANNVINEINEIIETSGKVLLLCDGGNKNEEFNLYAPFLKKGDVIMLHDYGKTKESWKENTSKIGWKSGHESYYSAIEKTVEQYSLVSFKQDEFESVLWGSFIKE